MVLRVLADILQLYLVVLFVRIIFSWFPVEPYSSLHKVVRVFAALTDPILAPLRRLVPPLRLGGAAIDLSPLILFFAISVVRSLLLR